MENSKIDILDNIDLLSLNDLENQDFYFIPEESQEINQLNSQNIEIEEEKSEINFQEFENIFETEKKETTQVEEMNTKQNIKKGFSFLASLIYFIKYITASSVIFTVLLLTTNYSAYIELAKASLFSSDLKQTQASIINSVEASKITDSIKEKQVLEQTEMENKNTNSKYSIKSLSSNVTKSYYKLDIDITPYENRIIIPKIGKNIPLVDVKNRTVSGAKELENIFMEDLKNGVVRYPGSAKPGQDGNAFIFGHSSNFPWIKGDYNDVFALLDKLEIGDEIIIFYNQAKYVYKINKKQVVNPGQVGILKKESDTKKLSLMTCWPVGTTLNRLIVSGEMVSKN